MMTVPLAILSTIMVGVVTVLTFLPMFVHIGPKEPTGKVRKVLEEYGQNPDEWLYTGKMSRNMYKFINKKTHQEIVVTKMSYFS